MQIAAAGPGLAFVVVFSIFVVAFVGLLTFIAVWAIRRDAAGRKFWDERRAGRSERPPER